MNIQKAFAFKILVLGEIVASGICGTGPMPDGSCPDDEIVALHLVRAAIDNGTIDPQDGTLAVVELLWADDSNIGILEEAVRGSSRGRGTSPAPPFMTDKQFLKECGIEKY